MQRNFQLKTPKLHYSPKNIKTPPFSAQNQTQMRCAAAVVAAAATPAPPSPVQCSVATDLRLLRVGNGPKN